MFSLWGDRRNFQHSTVQVYYLYYKTQSKWLMKDSFVKSKRQHTYELHHQIMFFSVVLSGKCGDLKDHGWFLVSFMHSDTLRGAWCDPRWMRTQSNSCGHNPDEAGCKEKQLVDT